MTKTKRALEWIAQGRPRKDMEADLGLTAKECRILIKNMRRSGYIEPAYQLTDKGEQRNQHTPKTDAEVLAAQREFYRLGKPESTEKMIVRAVRSQPNSVFAMGAMT